MTAVLLSSAPAASAFAETAPRPQSDQPYLQRAEVREFIRDVAARNALNQHQLAGWFTRLTPQQHILNAVSTPAERTLTWKQYRPIFLGNERVVGGREFIRQHAEALQRAEKTYGVPVEIIAAIIGVETFYGRHTGKHPILAALSTLAFDYPPRSPFFTKELEAFLILASEEGWNPLDRYGSYAGAMGFPQFIASSYRAYAVDFDGDGRRDLINSVTDAIGSVANYLAVHGWESTAPIAEPWVGAAAGSADVKRLEAKSLKPAVPINDIKAVGFDAWGSRPVSVMLLDGKNGTETWVGYNNFYVITRYNHSRLYAMAVMQLAQQLKGG